MDLRPAPLALLDAASALTTGFTVGPLTLAAEADAPPPEWIKLTPKGAAKTRDGRTFTFDPARLAARFKADGVDIAVDLNHSTVLLGGKGEKPDIMGYVKAVEARDDGVWGRIDWLDPIDAKKQIRSHRYVSPSIHPDEHGDVKWLHSIGLVPAPALGNMGALAHAHPQQDVTMKKIAQALGLADDATEDACVAAIGVRPALKPLAAAAGLPDTADAAQLLSAVTSLRAGGNGLVTELQGKVTTLSAEVNATRKTMRDRDVAELLDGALRDKKIVPAQRASYVAMCATDDGIANVRQLLAATPALLGASGLDGLPAPTGGDGAVDPVTLAAEAQKLVAAGTFNNIADAVMSLHHKKG